MIRDFHSRRALEQQNSFGDIVYVVFQGFEKYKHQALLTFSRQMPTYLSEIDSLESEVMKNRFSGVSKPFVPDSSHMSVSTCYEEDSETSKEMNKSVDDSSQLSLASPAFLPSTEQSFQSEHSTSSLHENSGILDSMDVTETNISGGAKQKRKKARQN